MLFPYFCELSNCQQQGFGLAGGVVTDTKDSRDRLPARAAGKGTFAWGGAAGTYFFCDPVNQLTVLMVTQVIYTTHCPPLSEMSDYQ